MNHDTLLDGNSLDYLDALYEQYLQSPQDVPEEWRDYFSVWAKNDTSGKRSEVAHKPIQEKYRNWDLRWTLAGGASRAESPEDEKKQYGVYQLIDAYRRVGHFIAKTNPLGSLNDNVPQFPELSLSEHNLSEQDLNKTFQVGSLPQSDQKTQLTLAEIIEQLQRTYCHHIAIQYNHISNHDRRLWLQNYFESSQSEAQFKPEEKLKILKKIVAAETLERYLHTRYVSQKRFSLEGSESLIPMLHALINDAGDRGVKEVVIGMAHRGRLNVLVNVLGKSPAVLFDEFEGKTDLGERTGDVKYHLGYSSDMHSKHGEIHVSLHFNPSHLEIVGPVVIGSSRARQDRWDRIGEKGAESVIPVVLHGDAAFAGQGVNQEMLNMSETSGYKTHGTIHIVINNQIGFTTSAITDARSSYYCSDVAKMVNAPIFHVNGDDPEAVVFTIKAAMEYRNTFRKDVVIDMVCYRKSGHNEADEPAATQPLMYQKIRNKPSTREVYAQQLIQEGVLSDSEAQALIQSYRQKLENGETTVDELKERDLEKHPYPVDWSSFVDQHWDQAYDSSLSSDEIRELGSKLVHVPDGFQVNGRVKKVLENRQKMALGELPMDWGFCENLAYATLLKKGHLVRLSGEDCGRGTFFHRHAVLHDQSNGNTHTSLENIDEQQAPFTVINSLLSEEAVLAFEYGYSTTAANSLVIWEAQFGDFANGAQVVIDQFISSGEQKWARYCGLVLYLPHGYEGQGPEHSSARLERFLQLCAQNNMQICVPTTPAQMFHLLQRQILRPSRLPLIVFTPKSLLRHPKAISSKEDLIKSGYQLLIPEVVSQNKAQVDRLILCSGKVYYDLQTAQESHELTNSTAIVRLEQLYPFPQKELAECITQYPNLSHCVWCQEEPANQGAWLMIQDSIRVALKDRCPLTYAGREASASPAVGLTSVHAKQQAQLVKDALNHH